MKTVNLARVSVVLLRVTLGIVFLWAGATKFGGWTAEQYLAHATGPFASFFQAMAGSPVVDALNIVGLTAVGTCLVLGFAIRPAAVAGIALMGLYYFADFEGNTAHGIIDQHLVYAVALFLLAAQDAGREMGLGGWLAKKLKKTSPLGKWTLT